VIDIKNRTAILKNRVQIPNEIFKKRYPAQLLAIAV
jgi:hypothetical protein